MFCTFYYALPLAVSIACSYLTQSLISNRTLYEIIDVTLFGCLAGLIIFLTSLPPIWRWFTGMRFQGHRWEWNVPLLIFFAVVALLLTLSLGTLDLISCHIASNYICSYKPSPYYLVLWLVYLVIMVVQFRIGPFDH